MKIELKFNNISYIISQYEGNNFNVRKVDSNSNSDKAEWIKYPNDVFGCKKMIVADLCRCLPRSYKKKDGYVDLLKLEELINRLYKVIPEQSGSYDVSSVVEKLESPSEDVAVKESEVQEEPKEEVEEVEEINDNDIDVDDFDFDDDDEDFEL